MADFSLLQTVSIASWNAVVEYWATLDSLAQLIVLYSILKLILWTVKGRSRQRSTETMKWANSMWTSRLVCTYNCIQTTWNGWHHGSYLEKSALTAEHVVHFVCWYCPNWFQKAAKRHIYCYQHNKYEKWYWLDLKSALQLPGIDT